MVEEKKSNKKYVGNSFIEESGYPRKDQGYNAWHKATEFLSDNPYDDYAQIIQRMKKKKS